MCKFSRFIIAFALGLACLSTAFADGGGGGTVTGCRMDVGPFTLMFSAYQPQLTADAKFCTDIPGVGRTNLVIDYEAKEGSTSVGSARSLDKEIKKMKAAVELIREKDGQTIVAVPPQKLRGGILETVADLSEPGEYELHVKLIDESGKEMENHLNLSVGADSGTQIRTAIIVLVVAFAALYFFYLSSAGFRQKVDSVFGKLKNF